MGTRHVFQLLGDPGVIGFDQAHLTQVIVAVGIKASADKYHLRRKRMHARQPLALHQCAHRIALGVGGHRHVQDVVRMSVGAAIRVMRMLKKTHHQNPRVIADNILGAIAVVHIKIHNGHALQAMVL